jgi:hypothetical protein
MVLHSTTILRQQGPPTFTPVLVSLSTTCCIVKVGNWVRKMAIAADTKGVAWDVPDRVMSAACMLAPGARIVSKGALQAGVAANSSGQHQTSANTF